MDLLFLLPALLFTLLAVIVATVLFNSHSHRSPPAATQTDHSQPEPGRASERSTPKPLNPTETQQDKGLSPSSSSSSSSAKTSENRESPLDGPGTGATAGEGPTDTQVESGPVPTEDPATEDPYRPVSVEPSCDPASCPDREAGSTQLSEPETSRQTGGATHSHAGWEEVNADGPSLKYIPGVLRMSQLEKMMTKEELEAEQRAQQEQLAAIFQLLKANQETFGEVSEGDMEEQLKLYSI